MNQWIYILRPTRAEMLTEGPTDQEKETVGKHFAYLQDLTEKGTIILVGRTQVNDARTLGLCVYRAETEEDAHAIMVNDPAIVAGVMSGELFPFRVALAGQFPVAD